MDPGAATGGVPNTGPVRVIEELVTTETADECRAGADTAFFLHTVGMGASVVVLLYVLGVCVFVVVASFCHFM